MAQVNVVATVVARPGREKELAGLLLGLVTASRRDAGCLSYHLHRALDNACEFVFQETWESPELLEDHKNAPHFQEFLGKSRELVESLDVKLLEKID